MYKPPSENYRTLRFSGFNIPFFSVLAEKCFKLPQCKAAEIMCGGQPTLLGYHHPIISILVPFYGMGIGVYR